MAPESRQVVERYYEAQIEDLQKNFDQVSNPDLGSLILMEDLLTNLKSKPETDPRRIAELEAALKLLRNRQTPSPGP